MSKNSYAILVPKLSRGGAENMAYQYGVYLSQRGHDVKFLVMEPGVDRKYSKDIEIECIHSHRISTSLIGFLKRPYQRSEIVISIIPLYTMVFFLSCYLRGKRPNRTIFTVHNNINFDFGTGILSKALRNLYLFYLRRSANVYAVSSALQTDLTSYGIACKPLRNKILFRYNFIERESSDKLSIIMIGRLTDQKDYKRAIDILEVARKSVLSLEVDIFGEGPLESEIREEVKNAGLADVVEFHGYDEDIETQLEIPRHQVLLLSSRYEGFGLVILEAISKGIYPIARDCEFGPREIISEGVGTLLGYDFCPTEVVRALENYRAWQKLSVDDRDDACRRVYNKFSNESAKSWKNLESFQ